MSKNSYKKLLKEIKKRDERIKELETKVAYLRYELNQIKDKMYKPKPPKKEKPSKPESKKRGALFGHIGWFRRKSKKIKRARSCHADETGWKLDGKNHWLWSFCAWLNRPTWREGWRIYYWKLIYFKNRSICNS